MVRHAIFLILALGLPAALAAQPFASAQGEQTAPKEERIGDGYLIQVLRPGAIPAIVAPEFVSREEGDKFMNDREPVLGVFDGQVAKAYSLWHLDRHEVVNDTTPGLGPIAVTW